ncbi:DUF4136 domain-containing protein [Galbibacter sp. EGI 63066]|uniref:DUF4136 domain-containing protein n=1 Tax=Galbibacter sp. EGI 63066 TaxID=2993559 RepID=UPI002248A749|nr:DUF4136 domain-containing protein [Galbibacter sp. EGI 63066]MCX2679483.1 DUF4136 domain-containing protein [Galbibacter sp. EGI 63066]
MKKNIFSLLLCIMMVSCGSVMVNYDYDKARNFSKYTSYSFYPDMESGLSDLDTRRITHQIDSLLQSRGFETSSSPNIYVNIKSSVRPKPRNSSVGIGIGGTGRNVGGGVSVGLPVGQRELYREIVIDIVDAVDDELVWQAVSEGTITENMKPAMREAKLKEVVEKVFSKYPPKQ